MKTIYLRFADLAEALALLAAAGFTVETETGPALPPLVMTAVGPVYFDLVFGTGIVTLPTGALDADGLPIREPIEGCHVNLLAPDDWPLPEPLAAKVVTPSTPACVFVA
jgi:hypothetical protein